MASAVTKGVAGVPLLKFLTEGWLTDPTQGWGNGGTGSMNSWTFSMAELIQGVATGDFGQSSEWSAKPLSASIKKNWGEYGAMSVATVLLTPMAFRLGKQILAKPIIRPANRLLRSAGIKEVKL